MTIQNLTTGRGTAIGDGIVTALDTITDFDPDCEDFGEAATAEGEYKPDIIVLLTDGVATTGVHPLDAARQALDSGVRVYTIAFGTKTGSTDQSGGGWNGPRRNRGIDEQALMTIASMTGGEYYTASSAGELQAVFDSLPTMLVGPRRDGGDQCRFRLSRSPDGDRRPCSSPSCGTPSPESDREMLETFLGKAGTSACRWPIAVCYSLPDIRPCQPGPPPTSPIRPAASSSSPAPTAASATRRPAPWPARARTSSWPRAAPSATPPPATASWRRCPPRSSPSCRSISPTCLPSTPSRQASWPASTGSTSSITTPASWPRRTA